VEVSLFSLLTTALPLSDLSLVLRTKLDDKTNMGLHFTDAMIFM